MAHLLDCDLTTNGRVDPRWGWTCTCDLPTRVLADVAAKRSIVSMCAQTLAEEMRADIGEWDEVRWRGDQILSQLASVYAEHPDFDPAWRA